MEVQQLNAKCELNEECRSGACEYALEHDSAGRPSLNKKGGTVCVVPRDKGDICDKDDACKGTLSCVNLNKQEVNKVCGEKYNKGEWCMSYSDCKSNICKDSKCE